MTSEIDEGRREDLDDMMSLVIMGWKEDGMWKPMMKDVTPEDERGWISAHFGKRFDLPNFPFLVIREKSSNKVIAWTSLEYPAVRTAEEQKIEEVTEPGCRNINKDVEKLFGKVIRGTKDIGYDSTKHFRLCQDRKGSFTHPDYQRQGLMTLLTQRCNEIADREGAATFVSARPTSKKMFESCGFMIKAERHVDMSPWGGTEEDGWNWYLVREPEPLLKDEEA
ncbi:MAG: hypothetical protein Q9227_006508 [Pyrenula ochraceoflavens]